MVQLIRERTAEKESSGGGAGGSSSVAGGGYGGRSTNSYGRSTSQATGGKSITTFQLFNLEAN